MPIALSSDDNCDFDNEFVEQLPIAEKALMAHELDPSAITIAKGSAQTHMQSLLGPGYYDYTVAIGDESFTVTYPGDQAFLEVFRARCVAATDPDFDSAGLAKAASPENRRLSLVQRISQWLLSRS